jgi:hypothetical protein
MTMKSLPPTAHRIRRAFRPFRCVLPALILLLPLAASAMAVAPTRIPTNPRSVGNEQLEEKSLSTTPAFDPVKISISPVAFLSVNPGDQVVREFVVQNDSAADIDVAIVLRFRFGWGSDASMRSVSTSRKIPAHSIQTVTLFVPASIRGGMSIEVVNPKIYVNGVQFKSPPGIFNSGNISKQLSLPSSFSTSEALAVAVSGELTGWTKASPLLKFYEYSSRSEENEISATDTIQWPAIPQFYQSKGLIFRKTTDKFSPDAERAIHDAVMLGATEVIFVSPGTQWPEWAPAPDFPARPVVVPRGLGQSVILNEAYLNNAGAASTATPSGRRPQRAFPANRDYDPDEDDMEEKEYKPFQPRQLEQDIQAAYRNNAQILSILKEEKVYPLNPAMVFHVLPNIEIPNLSFAVVILALLAYIIIVGPVNYMFLVKRGKSVLMLLLTVPVISLVFVGIVILFVSVFEGWFSRASAVGLTYLDQQEGMGYTRASVNLYAPVPVRSLTFDPSDTVSFPLEKSVNVSLGRNQVVTGANKARVPMTYGVSRAEKHLEQLKVSRNAAGTLSVVNGLGAPVKILAMRTPDGEYWLPTDQAVQPGASAELNRFNGEPSDGEPDFDRKDLFLLLSANLLETAPGNAQMHPPVPTESNIAREYYRYEFLKTLRTMKNRVGQSPSMLASVLSPGMYIAETDRPLFYSPGCSPVFFRARHLVVGTFTLQESAHEN